MGIVAPACSTAQEGIDEEQCRVRKTECVIAARIEQAKR